MFKKHQVLVLLIVGLLSIQCTSIRSVERSISAPDYNGRQTAKNAQFEKKLNPAGIGLTVGATAAGAYAGYQSGIIQYNNSEHQQVESNVAGAVVGGLVGFGVASLTNYMIHGQGKRIRLRNQQDYELWAKKYNKNFAYVSGSAGALTVIDRRLQAQFQARSLEDARHFFTVFPQSVYRDRIFRQAMDKVSWAEIPELVDLHPQGQYAIDAKNQYYARSTSLSNFKQAEQAYPGLAGDWEDKAIGLVENYEDAIWVLNQYPATNNKKAIFINSLSTPYRDGQAVTMEGLIGKAIKLEVEGLRGKPATYARNYMQVLEELKEPSSITALNNLYKQYDWLRFPERQRFFLRKAWELSYYKYSDGDALLEMMAGMPFRGEYSHLNLNRRQVTSFLTQQLQQEAKSNISLNRTFIKRPDSNGDFDNWRSSFWYDALYVNEVGELKYLYHGEVNNQSKFTLPLEINFTGEFIATVDAEILNVRMSDIARFFGVAVDRKVSIGKSQRTIYIPSLEPGASRPFAVLFDLGKGSLKQGINIIGIQAYYEADLENIWHQVQLLDQAVTPRQLDQQRHWISMINQSMPTTKVKEMFGYDYEPDNYIFELPSTSDYQEWYGSDCGCAVVDNKADKDWLTGHTGDYFLVFENGMEYRYSYTDDGRFHIYDGIMGMGRTKFDSYEEMRHYMVEDCKLFYCED